MNNGSNALKLRIAGGAILILVALASLIVSIPPWEALAAYFALGLVAGLLMVPRILLLGLLAMGSLLFGVGALAESLDPTSPHGWWQPIVLAGAASIVGFITPTVLRRIRGPTPTT